MSSLPNNIAVEYANHHTKLASLDFSSLETGKILFYEPGKELSSQIIVEKSSVFYEIPIVDFVSYSKDYDAQGLFCYIPSESAYATWDSDHLSCFVFYEVNLSTIIENYILYFESQWTGRVGEDIRNVNKYATIDSPFKFL